MLFRSISEMIDFRKLHGASEAVLGKFSATELYLKRARKERKNDEIAVETRFRHRGTGSKRSLGNNGGVVGGREISSAVKIGKSSPAQVNPSDLTFATKFVAVYICSSK